MATFFTQFYEAVTDFPETGMELTIEDLEQVDNPAGQDVNTNERWSYTVRVRINGWLDTTGVVVRVAAQNGTKVSKSPDGPWRRQLLSDPMDIPSGHSQRTEQLYFLAPPTPGPQTLLEAHIADWNADFSSLQTIYSTGRDDLATTFATNVVGTDSGARASPVPVARAAGKAAIISPRSAVASRGVPGCPYVRSRHDRSPAAWRDRQSEDGRDRAQQDRTSRSPRAPRNSGASARARWEGFEPPAA